MPATVEEAPVTSRAERLSALANDPQVDWILVVDADAVLAGDALAAPWRGSVAKTALIGGRALVGAGQRAGTMFGPSRSGPDPFQLVPLIGPQSDRNFTELVRGPVDAPQRGAFLVSAPFVRSLDEPLDAVALHLDLAVRARAAGRGVVCEPTLTFGADEDSLALRRALGNVRRFAGIGTWDPQQLHRDPPRLRSAFVMREMRVGGNVRGHERIPYPPIDIVILAADKGARARAGRQAPVSPGGSVTVCSPGAGDVLRQALSKTGDRYVLVADAKTFPDRATIEVLVERIERNGHIGVALERATAPHGAVLVHCGRVIDAAASPGSSIDDVVRSLIARLPAQRLFAASPAGEIVPEQLPPLPQTQRLDAIFVSSSRPTVTQQTLQALLPEAADGTLSVVYPAGASTAERLFGVHAGLRLIPDDSDVQLAVGLNRALGASTGDLIALVRDDAQVPHGCLERLREAFRRIPRLGVAVPRIGGNDRPESLPDLGYRSSMEMQSLYDRRAEAFAREATLREFATTPVVMIARAALDLVGGFDEMFGFSRLGVEDFTRRVRAANFLVACCEDAYAHLFNGKDALSFIADLDDSPFLREKFEQRWRARRGFDAQTDRVPLRTEVPERPAAAARALRVLFPLGDEDEWQRARPLLLALATEFRVDDPLEVAVGLDGTFELQAALAALRELLLTTAVPMDRTLNVSVDFVSDIETWRDAGSNNVRVPGLDREALRELPPVEAVSAIRARISGPPP